MATNRQVAERLREFAENSPETPAPKDLSSGNMTVRSPVYGDSLTHNSRGLFILRAEAVSYSTVIGWLVWNTHTKAYEYWQTPTSYSNTTQGHESDFRWGSGLIGYGCTYVTPAVDSPYYARPRFDPRAIDVSAFVDTMDIAIGDKRRHWGTRATAITRLPSTVDTIDHLITHNVPDSYRGYDPKATFRVLYDMKATAKHLRSCMATGELDAKQAVATLRGAYALSGAWKEVK